jgi:hypothetical protein
MHVCRAPLSWVSGFFILSARSADAVGFPLSLDLCAPAFWQGRVNRARAGVAHRLRCAAPGGGVCPCHAGALPPVREAWAGGCGPDDLRPSGTRILGLWPLDPSLRRGRRLLSWAWATGQRSACPSPARRNGHGDMIMSHLPITLRHRHRFATSCQQCMMNWRRKWLRPCSIQ